MKKYSIGLDIGTNSVGWAVVDDNHRVIKRRMNVQGNTHHSSVKKNFWGVRLFEEGKTAQDTRLKRTTRRRYTRRNNRLRYLQAIFQEEMQGIDQNFFYRLDESFKVIEEKEYSKYPIFATLEEEVDYHKKFPTIYHLRKALADDNTKYDLRLVYLAIAHILKYRGHFLIEGDLEAENSSVLETFKLFLEEYNDLFQQQADKTYVNYLKFSNHIEDILTSTLSKTKKTEQSLTLYPSEKRNGKLMQFLKLIVGLQGDAKNIFEDLEESYKLQFSKEDFDEDLEELLSLVGDEYAELFDKARNVYKAIELSRIISTSDTKTGAKLSSSMIEKYENHQEDLARFKQFCKQKLEKEYYAIFSDETQAGYAGYINNSSKVNQEAFYKYIKGKIAKIEGSEEFLDKIEREVFLLKQRSFHNGIIPHQIHLSELRAIIANQGQYYAFLLDNQEKLETLLTFRIPYFVGPLANGGSDFSWLVRKESGSITPYNFYDKVNKSESAVNFIEKMTNFDTYLPKEKVLPKHSLIYEKYMVLNELTKVTYIDDRGRELNFSGEDKERIFEELFKKERRVTKNKLEAYLQQELQVETAQIKSGIDKQFNASFGTYHDLIKTGITATFLDDEENEEVLEDIIKVLTLFKNREMAKEQLDKLNLPFSKETMKKLARRHYTGWARFSQKLLTGIRDRNTHKTIMDFLMEDDGSPRHPNRNLMQLINDSRLSFKEEIESCQEIADDKVIEDLVQDLAGSPAIKRGITQSIKVVDELISIMGYPPQRIIIEMARENQITSEGKKKSARRKKKIETGLKELGSQLLSEYPVSNEALNKDKLFLYYLQNGKDMYTGESLDIGRLNEYDIDHIIPQSYVTDNSIENRVLVTQKGNRGKSDDVPSREVVTSQKANWQRLLKVGLLGERKFDNLTKAERGGLNEGDKARFINRQLVETRQITKNVAQLLHHRYNHAEQSDVEVVTIKSALTSQFRKTYEFYKVREVNDYHHAHDAYLACVVANTLLKVYPNLTSDLVYGQYRKIKLKGDNKATQEKIRYSNLMKFFGEVNKEDYQYGDKWNQEDITRVKKVMNSRQMNIVKKVEIGSGEFYDSTIYKKDESDKLIPVKRGLNTKKYGGYKKSQSLYFAVITHGKNIKRKTEVISINRMDKGLFELNSTKFLENKGYVNPKLIKILPINTLFEESNGVRRLITGADELQKGNQFIVSNSILKFLYLAKRYENLSKEEREVFIESLDIVHELIERVIEFYETYVKPGDKSVGVLLREAYKNQKNSLEQLSKDVINLLTITRMGTSANIEFLGVKIPQKRYRRQLNNVINSVMIFQSITGLYETRYKLGE
ncbi:type II CRISPR RNA-guided endonuclease Cas9 [Vagococcus zengguangii]|uniref:type II CRISPR RNA-guided endonuclease Cas9 n=1 Tax=Vagococcus zengguangii TaxID=2571750 RepID=UPI0011090FB0|nr:type II CRISPR RNA-guided endonuclease Cas9 [Vagococcus zengguangii]TLG80706.1 type II CRISPR RNA-guided endonuclease Cas9 [Vagococcus zengguangii]